MPKPAETEEKFPFQCMCKHFGVNSKDSDVCSINATCLTTVACYTYAIDGDS